MSAVWKFATHLARVSTEEIGQATTEYAIATAGAVLAAYFVLITFQRWLSWFYYDAAALISLPIP